MAANATGPDCERSARSIIAVTAKRPLVVSRIESLLRPCCSAARVAIRTTTKLGLPTVLITPRTGFTLGCIFVHREDQVERTEILVADAPRAQARQLIAAPPRMGLAALVGRVADVIAVRSGGVDLHALGQPGGLQPMAQHTLGRGRAAD